MIELEVQLIESCVLLNKSGRQRLFILPKQAISLNTLNTLDLPWS